MKGLVEQGKNGIVATVVTRPKRKSAVEALGLTGRLSSGTAFTVESFERTANGGMDAGTCYVIFSHIRQDLTGREYSVSNELKGALEKHYGL